MNNSVLVLRRIYNTTYFTVIMQAYGVWDSDIGSIIHIFSSPQRPAPVGSPLTVGHSYESVFIYAWFSTRSIYVSVGLN